MKKKLAIFAALIVLAGLLFNPPSATAQTTRTVDLAWDASVTTGVTYNIYRTESAGGCAVVTTVGCSKLNTSPITVLTYSDVGVPTGKQYFYTARAVNSIGESDPSNEVVADLRTPSAPTNLRIAGVRL